MSDHTAPPQRRGPDVTKALHGWWDLQPVIVPALALVLAFAVGAVLLLLVGVNPLEAYWALLRGMYGSPTRVAGSAARSAPYIGSALALAFALKAGLFNIGAEGQMLVGGLSAAWAGTWSFMYDVPSIVAVPLIVTAGFVGGAVWGGIPGVLRAKTGAHEVISTIMLNSVALFGSRWIAESSGPRILRDPDASVPRTRRISDTAFLPRFVHANPPLHLGIFIVVAMALIVWWVLRRTTFGFATNTVGTNPHAAHYAGISVNRVTMAAMALSGGFAGIAAASEVAGTTHVFQPGTFANLGFDGIAIALLARANPAGIIASAFLWGSLRVGASTMQRDADVSIDLVRIIQALVLLFVAADAIVRYLFRVRARGGMVDAPVTSLGST